MHTFAHGTAAWGVLAHQHGRPSSLSHRHHPALTSAPAAGAGGRARRQPAGGGRALPAPARAGPAPLRSAPPRPTDSRAKRARRGGAAAGAGSAFLMRCSPIGGLNAALWQPPLRPSLPHRCLSCLCDGGGGRRSVGSGGWWAPQPAVPHGVPPGSSGWREKSKI